MERSVETWWESVSVGKVIVATLIVAGVTGAFYLLLRFNEVVIIALAAVIVGTSVRLLVVRLRERGVPRGLGIVLVYAGLVAILVLLLLLGLPLLAGQAGELQGSLQEGYSALRQGLAGVPNLLLLRVAAALPEQFPSLSRLIAQFAASDSRVGGEGITATSPWETLGSVLWSLFSIVAAFVLAIYWTLEGERIQRSAVLLMPTHNREAARNLLATLEEKVSLFVIGQGVLMVAIFALSLVAYLLIGLPNALTLALIAGLMEAIPYIGPFLGGLPAVVIALTISPEKALVVIIAVVIIQQVENTLLVPRVMNKAVGVGPMLAFLSIFAFGYLFGVPGALIAIPVAAILQVLLDHVLSRNASEGAETLGRGRTSVLRYRVQELSNDIRGWMRNRSSDLTENTGPLEDEVESLTLDLELILADQEQDEEEE